MKRNNIKKAWAISLSLLTILVFAAGAFAQTAIGGKIYTGVTTGTDPDLVSAPPLTTAKVMVQNQHSGGAFITYGTVVGNAWSATVPDDGDYVIMFSAPGHDVTSREVTVDAAGGVTHPRQYDDAGTVEFELSTDPSVIDAYLPPLPLDTAGLLAFVFYDFMVNGEPDEPKGEDMALNGVTVTAKDEHGTVLATGLTGSQSSITDLEGTVICDNATDPGSCDGLYYFTGLPPGEVIVTSDASTVTTAANPHIPAPGDPGWATADLRFAFTDATRPGWYLDYTEEGGPAWDPKLHPGDLGTEDGGYLIWHGFVEKIGQGPGYTAGDPASAGYLGADKGSISGTLLDADGGFEADEPEEALVAIKQPGVFANEIVPDGLIILFTDTEAFKKHPVAVTEADPVTGAYSFTDVEPGVYKMMMFDIPLDYVWVQAKVWVKPDENVAGITMPWVPRFGARGQGYVYDITSGTPIPMVGEEVHIRYKSGAIQKTEFTDGSGWYNFNFLPEVEVLGHVDVELPPGYRGAMRTATFHPDATYDETCDPSLPMYDPEAPYTLPPCVGLDPTPEVVVHNAMNRYLQWYTANYRADLYLEKIPATTGDIRGFVYNDHLATGTWDGDGSYDPIEERTMHGATVELWDATGTIKLDETTTGKVDEAVLADQGWGKAYTWPLDEWGGVFVGPMPGFYEFRDLTPGSYTVKILPSVVGKGLEGFSASPLGTDVVVVPVTAGLATEHDFGVNTRPDPSSTFGVPLAGEIEGGVFDDLNVDPRGGPGNLGDPGPPYPHGITVWPASLLYMEKAGVPGANVGVYDHLGYLMGIGYMGNPVCFAGTPTPDACLDDDKTQKPEMERRFAPGVHIYYGNDPTLPGYCSSYTPLKLNYTFGQGKFKFEADWSLFPNGVVDIHLPCNDCDVDSPFPCGPWTPDDPIIWPEPLGMLEGENAPLFGANTSHPEGADQDSLEAFMQTLESGQKTAAGPLFASAAVSIANGQPWVSSVLTSPSATAAALAAPLPLAPSTLDIDEVVRINGANFGDDQGYSEVTLAGKDLKVKKWTDTYIDVKIDNDEALQGAIVVATTAGLSNGILVDIHHKKKKRKKLKKRSVWVDASNAGAEDGSKSHPWNTITEALEHLPKTKKHKYVYVAPGTYTENILIKDDNLHLIGSGPRETILQGDPLVGGPVIYIGKNETDNEVEKVNISGFTITGGSVKDDIGAGIFSDFDNHDIDINTNAIFRNGGYYGGGIWMHKSNHSVTIHSNIIAENGNYGGYAGGISVNDEPHYPGEEPHGQPEHIGDDLNPGPPPGTYKIYNNLLYHNYSPDYGAAIALYEVKDHLKVFGNVMIENKAEDHGGAMFFEDCGPVDLYANVFLRNFCYDDGGAVSFEDVGDTLSHVNIYNNLFAENIADDHGENRARGGALAFDDTFYARVFNNTIVGNIVAGSFKPAGGGIDSERHGHEYDGTDGPYKAPGYSDPEIYNNIIYGNWRLNYDQPPGGGDEEDLDFTYGINYVWTPDEMHVDNPHLNEPWETYKNSESFTEVHYNDIRGGYTAGSHNIDVDPDFVDPAGFNWRLMPGSLVIDQALYKLSSPKFKIKYDIEDLKRKKHKKMIDMGAFEWRADPKTVLRIPLGIMGRVRYPVPGSPSPND